MGSAAFGVSQRGILTALPGRRRKWPLGLLAALWRSLQMEPAEKSFSFMLSPEWLPPRDGEALQESMGKVSGGGRGKRLNTCPLGQSGSTAGGGGRKATETDTMRMNDTRSSERTSPSIFSFPSQASEGEQEGKDNAV